jgi:hypothetical protein
MTVMKATISLKRARHPKRRPLPVARKEVAEVVVVQLRPLQVPVVVDVVVVVAQPLQSKHSRQ